MSVSSMTGFGSATFTVDSQSYRVDVKSVNHRNVNLRFNLPPALERAEQAAAQLVKERLHRGAINVTVSHQAVDGKGAAVQVHVDTQAARALMDALQRLARAVEAPDPDLDTLLRHGDLLRVEAAQVDPEALREGLLEGLGRAVDEVLKTRDTEGRALADDMRARLARLRDLLASIEAQAPAVLAHFQERLKGRLSEAAEKHGVALDEARVVTELVIFSDKSDVTEETVRAATHLNALEQAIDGATEQVGKRLDFLAQELFREFNTIGSKCRDAGMAGLVVDAKVELEKVREQVQNIT